MHHSRDFLPLLQQEAWKKSNIAFIFWKGAWGHIFGHGTWSWNSIFQVGILPALALAENLATEHVLTELSLSVWTVKGRNGIQFSTMLLHYIFFMIDSTSSITPLIGSILWILNFLWAVPAVLGILFCTMYRCSCYYMSCVANFSLAAQIFGLQSCPVEFNIWSCVLLLRTTRRLSRKISSATSIDVIWPQKASFKPFVRLFVIFIYFTISYQRPKSCLLCHRAVKLVFFLSVWVFIHY